VENSSKYMIADSDSDILRTAETVNFPELHDRLILATAKRLDIPVISSDKECRKIGYPELILTISSSRLTHLNMVFVQQIQKHSMSCATGIYENYTSAYALGGGIWRLR